jgi:hypothetical protein
MTNTVPADGGRFRFAVRADQLHLKHRVRTRTSGERRRHTRAHKQYTPARDEKRKKQQMTTKPTTKSSANRTCGRSSWSSPSRDASRRAAAAPSPPALEHRADPSRHTRRQTARQRHGGDASRHKVYVCVEFDGHKHNKRSRSIRTDVRTMSDITSGVETFSTVRPAISTEPSRCCRTANCANTFD